MRIFLTCEISFPIFGYLYIYRTLYSKVSQTAVSKLNALEHFKGIIGRGLSVRCFLNSEFSY